MLRGEFVFIGGYVRESGGRKYYNIEIRLGGFIKRCSTNESTYVQLVEFQKYNGVFQIYSGKYGMSLVLEGVE